MVLQMLIQNYLNLRINELCKMQMHPSFCTSAQFYSILQIHLINQKIYDMDC